MNCIEINPKEYTEKALELYFNGYKNSNENMELGKELLNCSPELKDFRLIIDKMKNHCQLTISYEIGGISYEKKGTFWVYGGLILHSRNRNGSFYKYTDINFENIKDIHIHFPPTLRENAKKLLKKIHNNLWSSLKGKLQTFLNGGETPYILLENQPTLKLKYISSVFDKWERNKEMEKIKNAIENGGDYKWFKKAKGHQGRDLSISVENGNAWFTSEFPDCGNGDYWLLINPKVAVFCERD